MVKVVVIDANAISRNLLGSVLDSGGYDLVGDASPSPAGLAAMIKLAPQIVCIDIGAPDEQGWERLDTLRAGLRKALLFLVSASFDAGVIQTAAQRGVHGFIVKPFNGGTVLATIRRAVLKIAQAHRTPTASENPS